MRAARPGLAALFGLLAACGGARPAPDRPPGPAAARPPDIPLAEVVATLLAEADAAAVEAGLYEAFAPLAPDPGLRAALREQLAAYLRDPERFHAFPRMPLSAVDVARGLFDVPAPPTPAPRPVHLDAEALLAAPCAPERSTPRPVHPALRGLTVGGLPDPALDPCQLQRARQLAEVLNNLALDNGSTVTWRGETYTTVEGVFRALIAGGHRVVVTNDRFLAEFVGLAFRGAAVVAPMWIRTDLVLPDGRHLDIPSPHTHHTLAIEGPLLTGRLAFYLGISGGTSFRALDRLVPAWTGPRTLRTYDSAVDPERVLTLVATAAALRRKWTAAEAGLPAKGYGSLGVCNDSTAVVEYALEGEVTVYPLVHPPLAGPPADALDRILAVLPADTRGAEPADALRRLLLTLPAEDWRRLPFPGLVRDLAALGAP